jgi:hypothetical protein
MQSGSTEKQLYNILEQLAQLWQEMRQLQEQLGMQSPSSEPQPTSQEFTVVHN